MTEPIIPYKTCTCCNQSLPATTEFFNKRERGLYGLYAQCKKCRNKTVAKYATKYRENHRERTRESAAKYRANNLEKTREKSREWNRKNKPSIYAANKAYLERNPEKIRLDSSRRRSRKRAVPHTLTMQDWQHALDFFNGCCAVCGRQSQDLFGERTIAADHWIPLSKGGGTTPENIIPLCHGVDGCNNTKSNKDPEQWLVERYGKAKAKQILARIQAYFDKLAGTL